MVWVLTSKDARQCRWEGSGQPKLEPYFTCVKSHLPKILKAEIELNSDLQPKEITFKAEKQDANADGFQHPCTGDSGSGHWIQKDGKAILVGIYVISTTTMCGDYSHIIRTTDAYIMRFIREFAQF